jgi:transposase
MPSHLQDYLDPAQRAELEAIHQSDNPHLRRRATILLLLHDDLLPVQVATQVDVCVKTVYSVLHRFQAAGMKGLADRPRSGRPRKATAHYRQRLEAVLRQPPHDLFKEWPEIIDPPRRWTVNSLRFYLEHETGILLSYERLRVLLHEMGYVYAPSYHRTSQFVRTPPTIEQTSPGSKPQTCQRPGTSRPG